jgi:hypothetical protein
MKKVTGTLMGLALTLTLPTASVPAPACPDVESAREMLTRTAASQNDRELQASRGQDTQAPRDRSQDVQTPRAGEQEIQAPRNQDIQAPRGGNAPTASASQVPPVRSEVTRAATLVKEADAACQAGRTAEASQKAKAAIVLMKQ